MKRALVLLLKRITVGLGFPPQFGRTALVELELFLVRLSWRFLPRNRATLKRIRQQEDVRLNFGCGDSPFAEWINVDGLFNRHADLVIDLRRPLPMGPGSTRFIFSEHMIEHLRYSEALAFLEECHRILEVGGAIRIVAPDLHGMTRAYIDRDEEWFQQAFPYLEDPVDALNLIFHQGGAHHYIYDSDALVKLLKKAGFEKAQPSAFGASAWQELRVDLDSPLRTIKSVYVEASK